jgi:hypothetical protein
MNVYTHVAMDDLLRLRSAQVATDVESLPPVLGGPQKKAQPAVPADLAALASTWDSLPDHVRQAIATLAGA